MRQQGLEKSAELNSFFRFDSGLFEGTSQKKPRKLGLASQKQKRKKSTQNILLYALITIKREKLAKNEKRQSKGTSEKKDHS